MISAPIFFFRKLENQIISFLIFSDRYKTKKSAKKKLNRGKLGVIYVSASVSNGYETIEMAGLWQMALVHLTEPEYDGNGKCQSGGQSGMN